jgi:phosphoserine phosphatase RsbU/P
MGHGIESALLASRISSEVRHGLLYRMEPRDLIDALRHFMAEYFQPTGLFLTFFAARIDLERHEVTWSGAGHPSALVFRSDDREPVHLRSQNPLLGIDLPGCGDVLQDTAALQQGDRLFFLTDGLFEIVNANGRQLGLHGIAEIARTTMGDDLSDVSAHVFRTVRQYQHGPTTDDQTLVVAEIR